MGEVEVEDERRNGNDEEKVQNIYPSATKSKVMT
jgi:hypothetical protein